MRLWQGLLLGSNALAFLLMGVDKYRAVHGLWRVSERALFAFPLLGGAPGGFLGMLLFHHKTGKWYFRWGFFALALIQIVALVWVTRRNK